MAAPSSRLGRGRDTKQGNDLSGCGCPGGSGRRGQPSRCRVPVLPWRCMRPDVAVCARRSSSSRVGGGGGGGVLQRVFLLSGLTPGRCRGFGSRAVAAELAPYLRRLTVRRRGPIGHDKDAPHGKHQISVVFFFCVAVAGKTERPPEAGGRFGETLKTTARTLPAPVGTWSHAAPRSSPPRRRPAAASRVFPWSRLNVAGVGGPANLTFGAPRKRALIYKTAGGTRGSDLAPSRARRPGGRPTPATEKMTEDSVLI